MSGYQDTIVGLSSGGLPSGVAIIRISGGMTKYLLTGHGLQIPLPRTAELVNFRHNESGEVLDRGICLWFPAPASFTGEDCAEFHVHGGAAVVESILNSLISCEHVRMAEAGEFSRRAFENGKFDLTEIEGISDLISAQTEAQRKQAVDQSGGKLRRLYDTWRDALVRIQAMIAAEIDFVEEDDVPDDAGRESFSAIDSVAKEIRHHLSDNNIGEIIRDGFKVVIVGPPNAGKSTLINTLANRDVAIVTDMAGTTRDVLDVHLNIDGYEVIVSDTAGLRDTDDKVEIEGIRRATATAEQADLLVWLDDNRDQVSSCLTIDHPDIIYLKSKVDGLDAPGTSISCKTGHGVDWLISAISSRLQKLTLRSEDGVISRQRHRECLTECLNRLEEAMKLGYDDIDLVSENLRNASVHLGRITGKVDVEDLLEVIFSEFCVGK